jgi:nicotinate phosphoribosyltransferase
MAHSWVMAFEDEREAFERFAAVFPREATFLIDTYDTIEGARNATRSKSQPAAVRLDSGDLAVLAPQVRQILDQAGWQAVKIFASGDLNEYKIAALLSAGAPIDAFGVGTELVTVADAPSLGCVYKLANFQGVGDHSGRIKRSTGKRTYPGRKQVFRESSANGKFAQDVIGLAEEELAGDRLLRPVISSGKLDGTLPDLRQIQQLCRSQLGRLPADLLSLNRTARYPVEVSSALQTEYDQLARLQLSR